MPYSSTSVASPPIACTMSPRATSTDRLRAPPGPRPSRIEAGTTNPNSASQTTAANENQGRRNAAGRNTSEPTPIAVTHARRTGARPETRALAQAYEAAKNGAASANTTIDVAVS